MAFANPNQRVVVVAWLAALLPVSVCMATEDGGGSREIVVDRVLIRALQEIDMPALKAGLLDEIMRREGQSVQAGEVVAKLQDRQAVFALEQAETQARIARHLAANHLELETSKKKLQQALQAVKQQDLELKAAQLEAANQLRSQAAEKNQAVAKNEFERAKLSRANFLDSVSESELDGLRLNYEKAGLEAAQTAFELELAQLKAAAAEAARQNLLLAVESASVDVGQAESRIAVAGFNAELKQSELNAAKLHVEEHHFRSKLTGVVVDVYRQPGEWVEPGEPVLRILRLDRLRAEAFVKIDELGLSLENAEAVLEVTVGEEQQCFKGVITFVSPEIDPINRETSVWMEFDNQDLIAKPGMHGRLRISIKDKTSN
jgi:multidrug efflux pump subunit AcrA (membrane-fusion protein)